MNSRGLLQRTWEAKSQCCGLLFQGCFSGYQRYLQQGWTLVGGHGANSPKSPKRGQPGRRCRWHTKSSGGEEESLQCGVETSPETFLCCHLFRLEPTAGCYRGRNTEAISCCIFFRDTFFYGSKSFPIKAVN